MLHLLNRIHKVRCKMQPLYTPEGGTTAGNNQQSSHSDRWPMRDGQVSWNKRRFAFQNKTGSHGTKTVQVPQTTGNNSGTQEQEKGPRGSTPVLCHRAQQNQLLAPLSPDSNAKAHVLSYTHTWGPAICGRRRRGQGWRFYLLKIHHLAWGQQRNLMFWPGSISSTTQVLTGSTKLCTSCTLLANIFSLCSSQSVAHVRALDLAHELSALCRDLHRHSDHFSHIFNPTDLTQVFKQRI